MPDNSRLNLLFNLYTESKATEAEVFELFKLLKQLSAEKQLDDPFINLWNRINVEENIREPNWGQLYQHITSTNAAQTGPVKIKRPSSFWYYAAAAVFIGVFLMLVLNRSHPETNYITYTVPYKTTKTLIFADGSKATLNAGTTISYPKTFTGKTREVNLDGEAYFQVVHLNNKPFIVHSGKLQTQVLGTSFNVDAYSKAINMKVTVVSGKVSVKEASTGNRLMLTQNQQAVLTANTSSFKKSVVADAENNIAWQDGKLIFEDAPLDEIAAQLSLKFGVKTTLSNPKLKNCRISAVFQHKELPQILSVITRLTGSTYNLQNNKATIFGQGCSKQ